MLSPNPIWGQKVLLTAFLLSYTTPYVVVIRPCTLSCHIPFSLQISSSDQSTSGQHSGEKRREIEFSTEATYG